MRSVLIALCTLLPSVALAQTSPYTIHIVVDPPVIEPGQEATIELRAGFDASRDFAMAGILTSFLCSTGSDRLSGRQLVAPMNGPGTDPGRSTIAGVEGIIAGQLQFHDIRADARNPLPFWSVTYTPTFAPVRGLEVGFETRTSRYGVFLWEFSPTSHSRLHLLEDGQATLTVIACRADINQDQVLDIFDFLAFFNAFDAGEALTDFDFDGELTVFDFLAFQNRFDQGCP